MAPLTRNGRVSGQMLHRSKDADFFFFKFSCFHALSNTYLVKCCVRHFKASVLNHQGPWKGTNVGGSPVANEVKQEAPQAPNGGPLAWEYTLAAFLLFLISWGPSTGFGAFQNYYQRKLLAEYLPSTIAWIGTVNDTLLISSGVLAGPLLDRGYVRHLMVLGCFMAVLGEMMLSLSTKYYQIMLSRDFCSGIGSGLLYVPSIAVVNTMFTTNRVVEMGVVTSGTSLGSALFPAQQSA